MERLVEDLENGADIIPWLEAAAALAASPPPSQAAIDVLAERQRQIEVEGWTPGHDDAHEDGQLAGAAATYAAYRSQAYPAILMGGTLETLWPDDWCGSWLKPTTRRRDLVKACALILAEIERLDRASAPSIGQEDG
jgi:hypothetical protein